MARGRPFPRSLARLVRGGVADRPTWLATVEKIPPIFVPVSVRKPAPIVYPEDKLREKFLAANPEARRIPLDLKARAKAEAHIADRFVAIQARAMREEGLTESAAWEHAEQVLRKSTSRALELVDAVAHVTDTTDSGGSKGADDALFKASLKDALADRELLDSLLKERMKSKRRSESEEDSA